MIGLIVAAIIGTVVVADRKRKNRKRKRLQRLQGQSGDSMPQQQAGSYNYEPQSISSKSRTRKSQKKSSHFTRKPRNELLPIQNNTEVSNSTPDQSLHNNDPPPPYSLK